MAAHVKDEPPYDGDTPKFIAALALLTAALVAAVLLAAYTVDRAAPVTVQIAAVLTVAAVIAGTVYFLTSGPDPDEQPVNYDSTKHILSAVIDGKLDRDTGQALLTHLDELSRNWATDPPTPTTALTMRPQAAAPPDDVADTIRKTQASGGYIYEMGTGTTAAPATTWPHDMPRTGPTGPSGQTKAQ